MKSLTVQIPQPCHERWADMQPAGQGRFCASCQKTVVDYTALSDRELARVLHQSSGELCGQLRPDQINRPLVIPTQENSVWQHWLSVLTMGVLSWQTAQAQSGQITNSAWFATIQPLKPLSIRGGLPPDTNRVMTGRVMLDDTIGVAAPLPNATVTIQIGMTVWTAKTDSTGIYRLLVPEEIPVAPIRIWAAVPGPRHLRGSKTFAVSTAKTPIVVDDLVVYGSRQERVITGGGLAIVKSPSRWQRFKQKLFPRG